MVPADDLLGILLRALAMSATVLGVVLLFWKPQECKALYKRASTLVFRLLSYPVMLVALTLLFICHWLMTLVRYTAGRIVGETMTSIKVRVTFD